MKKKCKHFWEIAIKPLEPTYISLNGSKGLYHAGDIFGNEDEPRTYIKCKFCGINKDDLK